MQFLSYFLGHHTFGLILHVWEFIVHRAHGQESVADLVPYLIEVGGSHEVWVLVNELEVFHHVRDVEMENVIIEKIEVKVYLAEAGHARSQGFILSDREKEFVADMTRKAEMHCSVLVLDVVFKVIAELLDRFFGGCYKVDGISLLVLLPLQLQLLHVINLRDGHHLIQLAARRKHLESGTIDH